VTKKDKKEKKTPEEPQAAVSAVSKKREKKAAAAEPAGKSSRDRLEFSGKVQSIGAVNGESGAFEVLFALKGKGDKRQSYRLDPSDGQRFGALVCLLTAAAGSGTRVGVRSSTGDQEPRTAVEIEVRSRSAN
jgi:hypothetical protein